VKLGSEDGWHGENGGEGGDGSGEKTKKNLYTDGTRGQVGLEGWVHL